MATGIESNKDSTAEFDEFAAAGDVEIGDANAGEKEGGEAGKKGGGSGKPPKVKATEKPAEKPTAGVEEDDDAGEGDDDAGEGDDEGGDDEGGDEKPKKSAKDHQIERLKREKAALARQLREGGANTELTRRLENIEKGLSGGNSGDSQNVGKPAPDPSDSAKYPLGHLDDRYIEDKLEWLADQKAAERADAVLQRQQENERTEAVSRQQADLLDKVDDLSAKGAELFPDFQEEVVEAGMRGDWDLSQATFEACHEADNGAQILHDLSQDKKEARRVARLSPYQQMKFVQERDAEIGTGKKGRTKPQAGDPPRNQARGANSRTQINPATDNLNDFEKAWERDAKKTK